MAEPAVVPKIKRFYSRAELGMRKPRSVSHRITPGDGGVAGHYGGNGPNPAPITFSKAKEVWLEWQRMHMDDRGWNDIGYSFGFDQQGNVYAGRGLGVRTASQGTNEGNDDNYSAVWIGGGDAVPSYEAKCAYMWLVKHAREKGGAGKRSRPHSAFVSTSCCGKLTPFVKSLDNKAINTTVEDDDMATPQETAAAVWGYLIEHAGPSTVKSRADKMLANVEIRTYREVFRDAAQDAKIDALTAAVGALANTGGASSEAVLAKVDEAMKEWLSRYEPAVVPVDDEAETPA